MTEHNNDALGSRHTSPVPSGDSPPEQEAPSSLPPTPPSPSLDPNDSKISRKREREVSLEPATPQATAIEIDPARGENKERRTPAKKNRVSATLDSTQEEDVDSDDAASISRGVEDITWKNAQKDALPEDDHDMVESASKLSKPEQVEGQEPVLEDGSATEAVPSPPRENPPLDDAVENEHTRAADIAEKPEKMDDSTSQVEDVKDDVETSSEAQPTNIPLPRSRHDSDSDADGEKGLKRKLGDRTVSESLAPGGTKFARNGVVAPAAVKRPRDDPDADVNPRETKRPTPPPEEEKKAEEAKRLSSSSPPTSTVASTPTIASGFMRYASTSSPFASVTGPSVFGSKPSTTSPWRAPAVAHTLARVSPHLLSPPPCPPPLPPLPPVEGRHPQAHRLRGIRVHGLAIRFCCKTPEVAEYPGRTGAESLAVARHPRADDERVLGVCGGWRSRLCCPTPRRAGTPALGEIASGSRSGSVGLGILDGRSKEEDGEEGGVTFGERLRAEKDKESEETSDEEPRVTLTEKDVVTGEEDETLVWQARGKLYALSDQNTWKERGTGLLKLNVRRKDGEGARLVMRKDAVYTVLLNAPLFKGMKCTFAQDPRYIRFSVFEGGATTHYNFRVGSADQAKGLLDAINAHIPV
ncbi:hypothetical protein A0H81_06426 [Grifola frondosa]|uniref:RanBD1 domain-containing protein n=1 Tax=Grifola frondosa TaxID=5627 RepID=A0A1C7MB17_GRIFR|nr:hypothetical protein A0H81_06426 [Grifola frondosa]